MKEIPPATVGLRDPAVFREVYATHHAELVVAAGRVLHDAGAAEDVVQDVFLGLWLAPDAFDPARGTVRSYLMMVVRSRAVDRWRTRAVAAAAATRMAGMAATAPAAEDGPADHAVRQETARAVRRAVEDLPATQREAILLAYGGGLSVPEVATATGAPLGTVKSRVRLGLRAAGRGLTAPART